MHHRVSFVVFSGTEDLRAFSISSGVEDDLVDVCINLLEALADNHVLIGLGVASCKIKLLIREPSSVLVQREKENGRNALYDLVFHWTGINEALAKVRLIFHFILFVLLTKQVTS